MSSAREAIFSKVRQALDRQPQDSIAPRPALAQICLVEAGELEMRFAERLAATGVTLESLPGPEAVPAAVETYQQRRGLQGPIAVAPALATLDWQSQAVDIGTALARHRIGLGQAFAAIAATGSLVMVADMDSPAGLNFLPEHHLVVLSKSRLLGHLEQLWPLLAGVDSQAIHLITGPSSTADIGGHLLYGAHGPRAVHVLLIDPPTSG